ncbi:cytochrome c oxidase subunit 3 [Motiliproteus coralliicola]|uniref:cytochrome-c oxidase n=1 Tax=Motiliproteus coralliicola TaxID=2283196 RepID=A0A369WTY9_9GAMM|nr:cytochrome c oxidase subunit 3 [Motiliproteus coralliicola]RDE24519.1 cytochrome c oxidase subunit 3 [Motiliproteus coralliicola]
MSSPTTTYYVPESSRWPIIASIALFLMALGAAGTINALESDGQGVSHWLLIAGALLMIWVVFRWFAGVIRESQLGLYSDQIDRSFRWGMSWFIFSEVMFFAAFFGALFYVRNFAVPWLGGEGDKAIANQLWQGFSAQWPLMQTPDMERFPGPQEVISPWGIPLLNTVLLLSSSVTLTIAHKSLKLGDRDRVQTWLGVTILLGLCFLGFQIEEYIVAYTELGLTLQAGIYGATFFILTGFHGAHVTLGTVMLIIIFIRVLKGHFSADNHFGFEAVSWYWHFVDVVWVGLFLFVYIL